MPGLLAWHEADDENEGTFIPEQYIDILPNS